MTKANRYLAAFKENHNVVGLAAAVALSAATLNPLPLLLGLVAEAAYLLFVPDSKWYDARLSQRHDAEVEARRHQLKEQTLPQLGPEMQQRFARLEHTRNQINAQAENDERWFREVLRKLDYLLEKFLLFGSREFQFRAYLQGVAGEVRGPGREKRGVAYERYWEKEKGRRARGASVDREPNSFVSPIVPHVGRGQVGRWVDGLVTEVQAHYQAEVETIRALIEAEQDANTKAVLEKRADVLEQRHEHVGKIGRILVNLNHQLELLEDTFGLINDQIRARSPEQVLADIESVVYQTDSMTKLLDELAPYEQMATRLADG